MDFARFPFVVVGSGIWGSVLAERIASQLHSPVLVIEKRPHIGGNCYSSVEKETGIECHAYGTHVFHTKSKEVWNYITKYSHFTSYQHKVFTEYRNRVYPMPISLATINSFFEINLRPHQVNKFLAKERGKYQHPANLEEKAISLIGERLYRAFIFGYTKKQWGTDPSRLPESIINRLPVRFDYNTNYFDDIYQGLPVNGYQRLFQNILKERRVTVLLNTDFFSIQKNIAKDATVFFSGPIDSFFGYKLGRLEWRSLKFKREIHHVEDYQGTAVMNFADEKITHTRIHEFRHLHPERSYDLKKTVISKEFPENCYGKNEPYYPIDTEKNHKLFEAYRRLGAKNSRIIFGGRLGSYRYLDMDKAIAAALEEFNRIRKIK